MADVWIAGCSKYEITGVMHLLENGGISAGLFRSGIRLRNDDTLILCFSSALLLGWWRYLKIIQWMAYRYDARLIVLCPDEVFRAGVICGRNIMAINGESACIHLSRRLQEAVQSSLSEELSTTYRECLKHFFLESAAQVLQLVPARGSYSFATRRAYRRRDLMIQRLGFASLMALKVFMAGFLI